MNSILYSPRDWFLMWVAFSLVKGENLAKKLINLVIVVPSDSDRVPASGSWEEPTWAEVLVQVIGWGILILVTGLALVIVLGVLVVLFVGVPFGFTPPWLNWMLIPCGLTYIFWFCVAYSTIERLYDHVKKVKHC